MPFSSNLLRSVLPVVGLLNLLALSGCLGANEQRCDGRGGPPVGDSSAAAGTTDAQQRAAAAVDCDAYEITGRIAALAPTRDKISSLQDRTRLDAQRALAAVRSRAVESSRLPLSSAHRDMYAAAAAAERASGSEPVLAWATDPWMALDPLERPAANQRGELAVALMRGERRALAVNVRNTSAVPRVLQVRIFLANLPGDALQIYRVNWTGNDKSDWAAAELEPLGDASASRETLLLPGITQQIWMQISPDNSADAGRYSGSVEVSADGGVAVQVPLTVTIFRTQFPREPSMHFGGWDYADGSNHPGYAVTRGNSGAVARQLQAHFVDTPWAGRQVLHWDDLDLNAGAQRPPDASALQHWMAQWTGARRFRVLVDVDDLRGIDVADDRFAPAVATWARAWAAEIRRLGKSPEQFDLLLRDEPGTSEEAAITEAWSRAIRGSGAGFRIWVDPVWQDPLKTPQSLIDAADTIAINLALAEKAGDAYWDWARRLAGEGKTIELYANEGPARRMDPYGYYRLTAWRAFFAGATAVSFWSFSDTGGGRSDNEFAAAEVDYSPLFIGEEKVRSGKHMEAAVEGIEDAEYLQMLQVVAHTHALPDARHTAAELLDQVSSFVASSQSSWDASWKSGLASTQAEQQRIAIALFLDSLIPDPDQSSFGSLAGSNAEATDRQHDEGANRDPGGEVLP
jgi:hypothetical protein